METFIYKQQAQKPLQSYMDYWSANEKQLDELDEKARKAGSLVGRVIRHPYADSYAVYQIVKENKSTVRVRVCHGLGDDWTLPAWGRESTINKQTALQFVQAADRFAAVFGR